MKLLAPLALLISLASANSPRAINIASFEEQFINTIPARSVSDSSNTSSVTLVGYKSIPIEAEHVADFEKDYYANTSLWGNNRVYDRQARAVRVYFPVAGALVGLGSRGEHVEADLLGRIPSDQSDESLPHVGRGLHVLGRRKTEQVTGVEGNIVRDGVIYLSEPAKPVRHVGRAIVYDFGGKELHSHGEHGHPHVEKRAKKSCLQNHNGKNCSKAYGINKGRCKMNSKACMDYNGLVTDCKNYSSGWKKYRNFVDSDCDVSLGKGHCWNEIM
ncbi:uncharacterized protein B0H64DRAFT_426488 [Chaetomium fimeti]|jgi:hypothetical protein|uniref:Uncharacterized protein n=1 Tax=Chaetomium fimeti TaxID=1854472 RepID=A0AAE0H9B7_9PEZI|nr:hypothetical protein B0H64DRAFT_426488 [Chaetomium fimeti]